MSMDWEKIELARRKAIDRVDQGISGFVSQMMPPGGFVALVGIILALYLSGVIYIPDQCEMNGYDISTCALFLEHPTTNSHTNTMAWTIITIALCSIWILMLLPEVLRMFTGSVDSMRAYISIITFIVFGLFVTLVTIGSIELNAFIHRLNEKNEDDGFGAAQSERDQNSQGDNGVTPFITGLGIAALFVLCLVLTKGSLMCILVGR